MSADLPWFPFFPKDWLTGQGTLAMTAEQQGAYINLLAHSWQMEPPCTLPSSDVALAKLANVSLARWRRIGPVVRDQFEPVPSGLRHAKLYGLWIEANDGRAARNARVQRHRKALRNAPVTVTGRENGVTVYADVTQQKAESESETYPPPPRVREALGDALAGRFADWLATTGASPAAFLAECNVALDGMHGVMLTPAQLALAVTDVLANGERPNLRRFRGYLAGAKPLPPRAGANGAAPLKPSVVVPDYPPTEEMPAWKL